MSTLTQSLIELNNINEELERYKDPEYISPEGKAFLESEEFKTLKKNILDDFSKKLKEIFN